MKPKTNKNLILRSSMALAVMFTIQFPAVAWSAEPTEPGEDKGMMMDSKIMENHEEMHKAKQKMQVAMKAQDAELTAAVAAMNSADQDKKLDLLADVVTKLVNQRTAMHAEMSKMEGKMMPQMMGHMKMGGEAMCNCPMMEMKGMDEKSINRSEEHHQE